MPTGSTVGIGTTIVNALVSAGFTSYLSAAIAGVNSAIAAAESAVANQPSATASASTGGRRPSSTGSISRSLMNSLQSRTQNSEDAVQIHLERIVVLDEAKEPYKVGISRVDKILLDTVDDVNDKINDVNRAYQARIDSGCRTDLFWRLISAHATATPAAAGASASRFGSTSDGSFVYNYTYKCTRLNPTGYPSLPTPTELQALGGLDRQLSAGRGASRGTTQASGLGPSVVGIGTDSVDIVGINAAGITTIRTFPLNTLHGLERVDLYGLKMYDEPYTADIGDTHVTQFIGTCGVGTNFVVAMSPINTGGLQNIKPGQLLICDKPNVFVSEAYVITGVGTAIANLSGINTVSVGVTAVVVPKLTLDANTIGNAFAPEDNGDFVTFTVLADPDSLGNLGIGRTTSPYVPQTIKCPMQRSDIGKGIRLEFINNGDPAASPTWNPFMEGEFDPDSNIGSSSQAEVLSNLDRNRVREPRVGAGRVHHRIGFDFAPIIYTNLNRTKYRLATEGETVVLRGFRMEETPSPSDLALYRSFNPEGGSGAGVTYLPSCSVGVSSALNLTINVAAAATASIASTTIQSQIELANVLRDDMMDINLRIWSERTLLFDSNERISTYSSRENLINSLGSILGDY